MRSSAPRTGNAGQRSATPALRARRDAVRLLERILDTPHLARVVPRLPPEVLHRVIETCGLEDCGEFVALATSGQLAGVFDLDLWRADEPGRDERFDADRFGVWLDVLVESGAEVAARKLAEIDVDLVIAALAEHVAVVDCAAGIRARNDLPACEIGGYRVVATRTGSWDAIVAVLLALDAEHPDYFHQVMRGCRGLSNSAPEVDGLDDLLGAREQVTFDVSLDRERRREQQGYAAPAQARAFLQMSRQLRLEHGTSPPTSPVTIAYFRALEWTDPAHEENAPRRLPDVPGAAATPTDGGLDAVAAVVDLLVDAGVLPHAPRALLDGPASQAPPRLAHMQAHMQRARDRDPRPI